MERDWEATFRNWSKPSSETEQQKCDNAEKMVKAAIADSTSLSKRTIEVFPQGSYKNNTNVRLESDVDICVLCHDTAFYVLPSDGSVTTEMAGITPATYKYVDFRNEVEAALVAKFGREQVERGNKAFDIHENSYRVDADVVACFDHFRYYLKYNGQVDYLRGTELTPDRGGRVINWPNQHYENGVQKNKDTDGRYKFMVRVLKRLRNEMAEINITAAKPIPSYLIECLVWNTPNNGFGHSTFANDVRYVLAHTFNETMTDEECKEWGEVSELKYLFQGNQPWTRSQAHAFLGAAWSYVGFE